MFLLLNISPLSLSGVILNWIGLKNNGNRDTYSATDVQTSYGSFRYMQLNGQSADTVGCGICTNTPFTTTDVGF